MELTIDWLTQFDGLTRLEPEVRQSLLAKSTVRRIAAGTVIFGPGKPSESLLLLLDGRVRVQKLSESGREIVLYRVEAGQSCIMTTAAMLAYEDSAAEGIAETELQAAAVPLNVFDETVARSPTFRNLIFKEYTKRITELFQVIEDISFLRVDIRLAQSLLALSRGSAEVQATHQRMAAELGTAREVVSRQLGEFQRRGWIRQSRGVIEILDREGIVRLAAVTPE